VVEKDEALKAGQAVEPRSEMQFEAMVDGFQRDLLEESKLELEELVAIRSEECHC
jgi:hypothetical protein